jgi:S1-C subfamily serine protease
VGVVLVAAMPLTALGCGLASKDKPSRGALVKDAKQSVVALDGKVGSDSFAGSAFVYDAQRGLLVTNAHVTWGAAELHAQLSDGTEVRGQIAAEAPCDDLAAIVVNPVPPQLQNAKLTTTPVKPGDTVVAAGYTPTSEAGRKLVVTEGSVAVSQFSGPIDQRLPHLPSLIEHQAPVTPSESGGPLLDKSGRVLGMNSVVGAADDPHSAPPFYAISTSRIQKRLSELHRSSSGRYVGWNDAHACHRPLEKLTRTLHKGYKSTPEPGGAMHGGAMHGGHGGHGSGMH